MGMRGDDSRWQAKLGESKTQGQKQKRNVWNKTKIKAGWGWWKEFQIEDVCEVMGLS
jgi:hypothetical protein